MLKKKKKRPKTTVPYKDGRLGAPQLVKEERALVQVNKTWPGRERARERAGGS